MYVGGPGLARGYLNHPELTAVRFVTDPFAPGERLYRTGDLARRRADGELEYLGRIDHQVKIRGFRIELEEIGSVLGQHPQVRESAVLATSKGDDEKRLIAYVVAGAPAPTVADLRQHLLKALPDYMVPSSFVFIDRLPLTSNGKVDRSALPAAEPADTVPAGEYVAPATPTEEAVAQIFASVLDVATVGALGNFFELGGHSLLATRALARLREHFKFNVPLIALFQTPTVRGLGGWIDAASNTGSGAHATARRRDQDVPWKGLVTAQAHGSRPPLFLLTGYMDADDTPRILSNLMPHLGPDQPLCGLRPRWLDGRSPQYASVAEMTTEYWRRFARSNRQALTTSSVTV